MNDLVKKYIELSLLQKEATESGDYKTTNKAEKKRFKIIDALAKSNSLKELTPLLEHDESNVRLWAAFDLLEEDSLYDECLYTLKQLYIAEKGIIGLGAEMTLKRLGVL